MIRLYIPTLICAILVGCSVSPDTKNAVPIDDSPRPILKGSVVDETGVPVEGAKITLFSGLVTRWPTGETLTDANGEYIFDPCRHGCMVLDNIDERWDYWVYMTLYHLTFASADGNSGWYITVKNIDRHVTRKDFSMVKGGTLSAVVVDAHGQPVPGLDVHIYSDDEKWRFSRSSKTGVDGRFEESGLFPNNYTISVYSPWYRRYLVIGTAEVRSGTVTETEFMFLIQTAREHKRPSNSRSGVDGELRRS